ncbi:unnamed protein product [Diatraea saccharalis]|uniref:Centrosome-associated protein 350 n=1 Tax=Diatraea saccharalis TaxID=40085 RepID=A0A9P0C2L6_9NEOP|nr:unnamed protein product [Diatraea saccharalis]
MDASASPTIDANLNGVYGIILHIENSPFPIATKNKNTVIKYTKLPNFDIDSAARERKKCNKASEAKHKNDEQIIQLNTYRSPNSYNSRDRKRLYNIKTPNKDSEFKAKNDDEVSQKSVSRLSSYSKYSKESKSSAKNIITNRKDLNVSKVNFKSNYTNLNKPSVDVSKTRPVKDSFRSKSGKMPSKISLSKNQETSRESDLVNKNKFIENVKTNNNYKTSVEKAPPAKLRTKSPTRTATFLKEIGKHKPVTVIHVPLDAQYLKDSIHESESQNSINIPMIEESLGKIDCSTEIEKDYFSNDVTIATCLLVNTEDKETQMAKESQIEKEKDVLYKCVETRNLQTDFIEEIFDSLAVPNVTLTKDKSGAKEEFVDFHSKSLPNLHVPSLKITSNKDEGIKDPNFCKGSYFIGHATVTCTTRQKINFHVVGNNSETISNQSPSPLAYPINVVSIFEKEMKRQKQHDSSFDQRNANIEYTKCLNELQTLNCSYVLNSNKLVKPSDIISTIKINNGLLQNEYICEQFQRELNFIDSFFESLQYLESCSLTDTCFSDKKVESLINNPEFGVNHLEYGSFVSKLENGANVDDCETMASKSLCLLNLLIRDEQRRAKNLLFVLKMREDALKDFTKSQILWLENKKKQENTDISTLKKKQRGALLKLQHECGEMQRMRKALLTQSEKRKMALLKTKKNIELKLKTNVDVDQIILGKKKLKRNVADRNTTPLKCFDLSSSGCEDSSASRQKSDIQLTETLATINITSAEKCIQTCEGKLVATQSTDTAAENFVMVDGGYLNILFHNLSVPEIFSSNKQYEVNEEALRNIVNSTNTNHSVNETDVERFINQIKNADLECSSPSTARSLVEELDQYYKGLVDEKLMQSPINDACLTTVGMETSFDCKLEQTEITSHSLPTVISDNRVTTSNDRLCRLMEEPVCIHDLTSETDLCFEKEMVMVAPTGPLPVPAGAAAGNDNQGVDLSLWGTADTSSSSLSDASSVSSQPICASRTSVSVTSQSEAEELRRQQLAIEREIKVLEQQQNQLLVVREIPDKPPPPYTPPADSRGAHTPRKYVADETTEEKIQKYMKDPNTELCDPTDAFDTLVKDFCIETLEKQTLERSDKPWDACNLLPQKPPEDTEKLIRKTSSNLLDILTGVGPVIVSGVSSRRSDHIDDVLFAEWRRCEPEWTSLQSDEAFVKNQIFEGIFQKILTETIDEYKRTVLCDE